MGCINIAAKTRSCLGWWQPFRLASSLSGRRVPGLEYVFKTIRAAFHGHGEGPKKTPEARGAAGVGWITRSRG